MIEIKNLTKNFTTDDGVVEALNGVTINIESKDIYGIIGMSGAGKSTLVRCINLLERPDEGTISIDGIDLMTLSKEQLRAQRAKIAMIFQNFNLLMQSNVLDNVCFPLLLQGVNKSEAKRKALDLLTIVGLQDKLSAYPAQLSGGQQQRVAIARALSTDPSVLLCDEPTSALDPTTTNSILQLIKGINEKMGITVIIITHQMSVVETICNHVAILDNGRVVEQGNVGEVFANPTSRAARALVFPEGEVDSKIDSNYLIRVVFNGANATKEPLIATMAVEQGIIANIAYASTRSINDKVYGSMLLGIDNKEHVEKAISYLQKTADISVQEVKNG